MNRSHLIIINCKLKYKNNKYNLVIRVGFLEEISHQRKSITTLNIIKNLTELKIEYLHL